MTFSPSPLYRNRVLVPFENSAHWDAADGAQITFTPGSAGNRKTWSLSLWFRIGRTTAEHALFGVRSSDANFYVLNITGNFELRSYARHSDTAYQLISNGLVRDIGAWIHVVVAMDTTQATSTDRHKVWVNGVQVSSFSTAGYPPLNADLQVMNTLAHKFGRYSTTINSHGGLALCRLFDGVAITADDVGEFSSEGVWIPKAYAGSYGTRGAYLDFSNPSSLGSDSSGNGNNFTLGSLTSANHRADGPTLACAWLTPEIVGNNTSLSKANSRVTVSSVAFETVRGNILIPPSGKWYWECTVIGAPNATNGPRCGVVGEAESSSEQGIHESEFGYAYRWDGPAENNGVSKPYGDGYTMNDVIGVAFDAAAGTLAFYLNGVYQGEAYTGLSGWFYPAVSAGSSFVWEVNFGQLGFVHDIPSGFRALTAESLPHVGLIGSSQAAVSVTDTGANIAATLASARSGWSSYVDIFKNRSNTEDWEVRFSDDAGNSLHFNTDDAKAPEASFAAGDTYIGMSIRTEAISGVYTDEIEHRLGVATSIPHGLVTDTQRLTAIVKRSDGAGDWFVHHPDVQASRIIRLNSDGGQHFEPHTVWSGGSEIFIDRAMPSGTYRVVVIAERFGVSRMTKFTGNGSASGPVVYGGFRPEIVLTKKISSDDDWLLHAWAAATLNPVDDPSAPNLDSTLLSTRTVDFLSNGIRIRDTDADLNQNGETFISLMLAASPFGAINGRAANGVF